MRGLFFYKMLDLSLAESEEGQIGGNGFTKMFLMLSVKKYLVLYKQSMISTGENTLPTLSALAPFGKENACCRGLFPFESSNLQFFLILEKPTFFY